MPKPDQSTLSTLADALTIDAFDQFRTATRRAGSPLSVINAIAAYKSAVDFALLAASAEANGHASEAVRLVGWAFAMLKDVKTELTTLSAVGAAVHLDYPAH